MEDIAWGDPIPAPDGNLAWVPDDQVIMVEWDHGGGHTNWYSDGAVEAAHTRHTRWNAIRLPADHWAYVPIAQGFTPWAGGDEAPGDWDGSDVLLRNGRVGLYPIWRHVPTDNRSDPGYDIIGYKPKADAAVNHAYESRIADRRIEPEPIPAFKAGDYVVASNENDTDLAGKIQLLTKANEFSVYFNDGEHDRYRPTEYYRPATPEEIAAHKAQSTPDNGAELAAAFTNTYERETVTIPKMTEEEALKLWHSYRDRRDTTTSEDAIDMLRSLGIIRSPTSIEAFEAHHGSGLSDEQMDAVRLYAEWSKSHDN